MITLQGRSELRGKTAEYLRKLADDIENGKVGVDRMTIETSIEWFKIEKREIIINTIGATNNE
nr:MAG TPA: hypothetical protein [Caudoviricetes sp.]